MMGPQEFDFNSLHQGYLATQPTTTEQPTAAKAHSPGILSRIVSGFTAAPKGLINDLIVTPGKEAAAELTGNKVAEQNAAKKQFGGATNIGQALERGAGEIGGTALLAGGGIGEGVGGGIATGAGFGATGAMQQGGNASDILSSAVKGGAVGGVLGKLLPGASEAGAGEESSGLKNLSDSLNKSVVSPKEVASPFAAGKADDLVKYLKDNDLIKAGDSAQSIYSKLEGHYNDLQGQITGKLAGEASTVPAADLSSKIEDAVNSSNRFGGTNAAAQTAIDNAKHILLNAADENGNIDANTLYSLKNEVQGELGKAFDKVAKGGALTGNEDALMAIRNTINEQLPDSVKELSKGQSLLHDASPGLQQAAAEKLPIRSPTLFGTLPGVRVPSAGLSHLLQGAKTGLASGLESAGDVAASPLAKLTGTAAKELAIPAAVGGVNGAQDTNQSPQTPPDQSTPTALTDNSDSSPSDNPFGVSSAQVAQGIIQAMQAGDTKAVSSLGSLYNMIKSEEKANQPSASLVSKSAAANQALTGLQGLEQSFNSTDLTGKGILSKLVGDSPIGGTSVKQINDTIPDIAASIAKATGAGSAKDIISLLPSATDSSATAKAKIDSLRNQISQYLQDQQAQDQDMSASQL